jgi:hypothetical protein
MGRACGCGCAACPRMQHVSVCFHGRAMCWWPGRNEFDLHLLARAERRSRRSHRYLAPRELRQSRVRHRAAACAEGDPHQCNASMITLAAVKTPGSSSARLATQGAHAHILDARGFAHLRAHLWTSARERVLAAAPQWARGRRPHITVVYHVVSHRVAAVQCQKRSSTRSSSWSLSHDAGALRDRTDNACPESSSAARNSGPMGLDNSPACPVRHPGTLRSGACSSPFTTPFARPVHLWGSLMGSFTVHRSGLQNRTEFGPFTVQVVRTINEPFPFTVQGFSRVNGNGSLTVHGHRR